jgi:acyl-CoA thioesterase-1
METDMRNISIALTALAIAAALPAGAAEINIVALGASNTYGKGVARGSDYPAQLQAMLRAQGHNARVANAGINGDTTAGMARRLDSAVPARTQVVILQPGGNDRRKGSGAERGDNVEGIVGRLNARGIKVIMLESVLRGMPAQLRQPDGTHLTPEGYRALAAQLLPQVTAAVGGWVSQGLNPS